MIYLDYSATTPVAYDVLESYTRATKDFMGNPNSLHSLGVKSKALMHSAVKQISDIFNVLESEITFTAGATNYSLASCLHRQEPALQNLSHYAATTNLISDCEIRVGNNHQPMCTLA